ncbi:2-oxoglutarate dehydrogenase E2 component [Alkalispirillum mobile]|uniref:Dihydrolipoyllysine-residue succinyltransferase component of 2-oxoglutarate dehydrogenase complex n=1 Tax=Alkalispirillum mobile TaxID=85925 RepID=A0A498BZ09_9GAMM|nr:2-oxoglutarate dehydrogenase complex dihydrolipoyllysine-residue succinyltransferase [Alkalispirillum mobile]RLK48143.1 2-oxoglutarate dehydrogenase E2 component [Alkalispirillum mobile]
MSIEVKVPPLPESVSEATIVAWHKQPGDAVSRDENLVDLETDKVVLEVPAPADGVMGELIKNEGDTVTADEVLGKLEEGAAPAKPAAEPAQEAAPAAEQAAPAAPAEKPAAASGASSKDLAELPPAARRLVEENDLDPKQIPGTGRDGRITKEDVVRFMKGETQPAQQPAAAPQQPAAAAAPQVSADATERPEKRVPMTRLRQRIAERLVEAQQTAAMLTTFNEVNMQPVMQTRTQYKDKFEKTHGIKLGFMSFFVKAAVEALKRYPAVNASIDGKDIMYHGYYDIGIAVSSPRGLVVPVLRDADQMSFAEIEAKIAEFGQKARDGKLSMEELTGGTFTITNGGIFGSLLSTPILNPPQSGIMGMHKIQERPMVENGEVVVRPMMYLAHSYDHRIIDGREAVQFLVTIKECLEDPTRLLLEV